MFSFFVSGFLDPTVEARGKYNGEYLFLFDSGWFIPFSIPGDRLKNLDPPPEAWGWGLVAEL